MGNAIRTAREKPVQAVMAGALFLGGVVLYKTILHGRSRDDGAPQIAGGEDMVADETIHSQQPSQSPAPKWRKQKARHARKV